MSNLTSAIAAACGDLVEHRTWWSPYQGRPTVTADDPCIVWFSDLAQASSNYPDGAISHVGIGGVVYDVARCEPGNQSSDGNWYQPIIYDGTSVSGIPYPACFDLLGVPTMVNSNAELADAVLAATGYLPFITNISGATVAGYSPATVDPYSLDPVVVEPLLQVSQANAIHRSLTSDSRQAFCPPPVDLGGTGFPPVGGQWILDVKNAPPIRHTPPTFGTGANAWLGPITVSCGAPLLKFTVDYDSLDDFGGFTVIDSTGTVVGITTDLGAGSDYSASVCGAPAAFGFHRYTIGDQVETFTTSESVLPGSEYWLHPIMFRGVIRSVLVEAVV